MTMTRAIDYTLAAISIKGAVTLYDPVTGQPTGRAVIQGCRPEVANLPPADGKPRMLRSFPIAANPRTPAQQARRAIHAAAVAAWQADPTACRATAAAEATARRITPFMAWCAIYHRTHAAVTHTQWDNTAATWDAGATTWDNAATTWDYIPQCTWDGGATTWD